jgi:hypothetical protein
MSGLHGTRGRQGVAFALASLLVLAASFAASTEASPPPLHAPSPASPPAPSSATATNTTTLTTTSQSSQTPSQASVSAWAILYFFIPELTVLAFFAIGIYLILVRGAKPSRRRARRPPEGPSAAPHRPEEEGQGPAPAQRLSRQNS